VSYNPEQDEVEDFGELENLNILPVVVFISKGLAFF